MKKTNLFGNLKKKAVNLYPKISAQKKEEKTNKKTKQFTYLNRLMWGPEKLKSLKRWN